MRKITILLLLLLLLTGQARAAEDFGAAELEKALPETAAELLEGRSAADAGGFGESVRGILDGAVRQSGGAVKQALAMCCQILAIVLLAATLRGGSAGTGRATTLAATLAIGAVCVGQASSLLALAARTVDDMTAFAGFLYTALASATAATGAVGSSSAIYGVTVLLCGVMTRAAETLLLPGISCCMALAVANSAVGDDSLKPAGDALKQLMTTLLKCAVLAFTAYLSLTGVISGSTDAAAVKAAKLAISSAVPVVGSMVADASETLLVSAGLLRSGMGVFGLLGVLAVSVSPFLRTGCQYLLLKLTAAAAGIAGEKELSGLIGAMAGAMGLLTGLTGACAAILMVGCVCFMKASA